MHYYMQVFINKNVYQHSIPLRNTRICPGIMIVSYVYIGVAYRRTSKYCPGAVLVNTA